MHINYDFADLAAFLAVKDTGSFHGASERLGLSQSAVTRRVKKLEDALDTVLFERTTRAVRPTLAAKRLQARAEAMMEDAAETLRAMRDDSVAFAHQRNLVVTIAAVPTIIPWLIPKAYQHCVAAGQTARIRLLDLAANEVAETVAQGEADLGLCSIPALAANISFERLFDDEMVVAVPRGHRWAGLDAVSWQALADETLILPAKGTGNRMLIDEAAASGSVQLNWNFETARSTTALSLVASGLGVALLPRSAVSDDVAWCRLREPSITRPIGLIARVDQVDTKPVTAMKTAIREVSTSQCQK